MSSGGARTANGSLTVKEKIELHLFDFNRFADAFEAPSGVTQEGIAAAAGIRIPHLQQYVKPLIAEGLVEERTSHVRGQTRRLKVYFLTERGRSHVANVRGALVNGVVPLRSRTGEQQQVSLLRIIQEERRGSSVLELLRELETLGYISETSKVPTSAVVDFTQEATKVDRLFGREHDLEQVLAGLDRAPVVVVIGIAGVGKSSLGSSVVEAFRQKRSVFWRQVRSWDTAIDIAFRLSVFLHAMGRLALHGNLMGPGSKSLSRVEELLEADLKGIDPLLVFDDVHEASKDGQDFFSILLRVLSRRKGGSTLLLTRMVPNFYSRREVEVDHSIVEVGIKGLDRESARSLLLAAGVEQQRTDGILETARGNPLFLRLLATAGSKSAIEGRRTLEEYIAEQVEPSLVETERACLEAASVYQVPVTLDGLLLDADAGRKDIIGLVRKGLLDSSGADRFVVHDSIRSYFERGLSSPRRETLVAKIVAWLLKDAREAARLGDVSRAIAYLGNVLTIEIDPSRRAASLEELGKLRGRLGDVSGALDAYRAALAGSTKPEARARLHYFIAKYLNAQGDRDASEREADEGLALLPSRPSTAAAWLLFQKAVIATRRQDLAKARQLVEQVASWMAGLPKDPELWGHLVNAKGVLHLEDRTPDYALAQSEFDEAIDAFRQTANETALAGVYNNLALAEGYAGHADRALSDHDRSIGIAKGMGDLPTLVMAMWSKADCLSQCLGDYDAAESLFTETYQLARDIHAGPDIVFLHRDTTQMYLLQGRYQEAKESQEYLVGASGNLLSSENRIAAVALLSRLSVLCCNQEAAEYQMKAAEELCRENRSDLAAQSVAWARGVLLAGRGETEQAEASYQRAYDLPSGLDRGRDRGRFLLDYGRFLASVRKDERAKEILSEASRELVWSKPLREAARETLEAVEHRSAA